MTNVSPRRSLELLSPQIDSLNADIAGLTPEQWDAASSCAGWQLADLVSHVVRNGWSILTFTQRALSGDPTPAFGPSVAHIQEEIKAAGPHAAAERQTREHAQLVSLIGGLSEADFSKTALHPSGSRTIAWGCTQRLAEVAFHHWDLRCSLGYEGGLEASVADYLLAFLMDPAESPVMRKPAEAAAASSLRLTSTSDSSSWLVKIGPSGGTVESAGGSQAVPEVSAEAGWLALALYGRASLADPRFKLSSPDAAEAFAACFA